MTSTPSSHSLGKSPSSQPATPHAPSSNQSPAQANFDTNRRTSSSAALAIPGATPRKGQASRKQHRPQRRPGMAPSSSSRGVNLDRDDALAELRAVRNPSSRRGQTSITHLLNYSLPPRQVYTSQHHGHSSSRSYRRNPTWSHATDKARYVHANYRFVVSPAGNYALQASEPDEHLDWGDVLQVIASAESQQTACPICLGEPVAPRMAKCGHIFCLPCLIRFMNSHADSETPGYGHGGGGQDKKQNKWRKCPICDDTVYMSDARPVRFYAGQESPLPRPGDDVVLRLMARNAKSTLALPREGGGAALGPGDDVPWHFAVNVLDYARIMKGTGAYMEEEYGREIEELLKQEKEDELLFHQDNEWTQRAVRAVTAAKEKVRGLGEIAVAGSTAAADANQQPRPQADHDFYFYTSPPHLYLSPLDIRILKTHFGSFSAFPSTLLPRVEHISTGLPVDDDVRKRAKYLGHLPRGCLHGILECDWTDIVPAEVLATFTEEIEKRRRKNTEKAAQEERERLQAERMEAAAIRDTRRGIIRPSLQDEEDALALRFGGGSDRVDLEHDFLPLGAAGTTPPNPRNGFAQLADVSTSPSAARTVWGTPAIVGEEGEPVRRRNLEDDGWLKDDEVLQTLSDADLALQMEALRVGDEPAAAAAATAAAALATSGTGTSTPGGAGGGGKGKKKKQKITLMSTGGRRGN